ncbi:hypothetical protein [Corynebacterium riegelii]|uniref:hypothetical protein n=1 Tax=Corynebacterium riegelii TaxID=156976 RepID=UPI00191DF1DC|nr:hypothetical protein [Corynebacterium riegelii]QQU83742.1 hypothetical protein I6I71_10305 [Corynebacterium riegelii]
MIEHRYIVTGPIHVELLARFMGDDLDEIIGAEKIIEPTTKLGVLVLCLVSWTWLRQVVHLQLVPGQMLIAFEFVCKTLKIRLVVGQCALAAAIAESLIEPSGGS